MLYAYATDLRKSISRQRDEQREGKKRRTISATADGSEAYAATATCELRNGSGEGKDGSGQLRPAVTRCG